MTVGLRAGLVAAARSGATVTFIGADGRTPTKRSWTNLLDAAARRADGLAAAGCRPGCNVVLADHTGPPLVEALVAVNLCGAVPIVLAAPIRSRSESFAFVGRVVEATDPSTVLFGEDLFERYGDELGGFGGRLHVLTQTPPEGPAIEPRPEHDVAFLQYSSGSTRAPRGVVVTQANLQSNLRAIAEGAGLGPDDVVMSWLPLYHDMGLIAGTCGPPVWGTSSVLMDPMTFIRRPSRWLRAISEHRATVSMAHNSAYEYCSSLVRPHELAGLDLSSWRVAWNGAERVHATTIARFQSRFAAYGLRPNVIVPCYGAAETTLKITSAPVLTPPRVVRVDRDALAEGRAEPSRSGSEVVSVGRATEPDAVRIIDDAGATAPAGMVGQIEVRGPSVARGYFGGADPSLTGGRFETGDLGFMLDGDLFVTGRIRDLIIVDGRNLYPEDLEAAAEELLGSVARRVAAFAEPDPVTASERVVIAIERVGRRTIDETRLKSMTAAVIAVAGTSKVCVVELDHIPATTSGKTRRGDARALHLAGESRCLVGATPAAT